MRLSCLGVLGVLLLVSGPQCACGLHGVYPAMLEAMCIALPPPRNGLHSTTARELVDVFQLLLALVLNPRMEVAQFLCVLVWVRVLYPSLMETVCDVLHLLACAMIMLWMKNKVAPAQPDEAD
jgi:hypothetical protein